MNKLIFTTKGKNKVKKISLIILGIVAIIAGFSLIPIVDKSSGNMKDTGIVIAGITAAFGIGAILTAFIHISGYVEIYPDHIEGKGKQGKGMNTFYLNQHQIKGATVEQGDLCVHSDLGIFKIICNKSVSNEACNYINKMIYR